MRTSPSVPHVHRIAPGGLRGVGGISPGHSLVDNLRCLMERLEMEGDGIPYSRIIQ